MPDKNGKGGGRQPPGGSRPGGGGNAPPPKPALFDDAAEAGGSQPIGADLRNALRTRAERIPLRALERRGFRNVQVLDMATIEKIVGEAVTHMLERHTAILSREDRAKLEVEARTEFAKLLAEHKRVVAEKSDGERAREALERQVQGLREELGRQQTTLKTEQEKHLDSHTFSLSPDSFREMEDKIRALFAHLVSKERRLSLAEAGPKALAGLSELEREVAAFLDRLLQGERDRFIGSVRKGQSETVELLEKRISKLNKALADTEDALHRVSQLKAGDPGIASIYESIQGLSPMDSFYMKKKELLGEIFKENLAIQQGKSIKRRADTEAAAAPEATPLIVPAGFEPPVEPISEETAF